MASLRRSTLSSELRWHEGSRCGAREVAKHDKHRRCTDQYQAPVACLLPDHGPIRKGVLGRGDTHLDLLCDRGELAEVAAYHVVEHLITVDHGVRARLERSVDVATVIHEVVGGHPVVRRRVELLARRPRGDGGDAAANQQTRIVGG